MREFLQMQWGQHSAFALAAHIAASPHPTLTAIPTPFQVTVVSMPTTHDWWTNLGVIAACIAALFAVLAFILALIELRVVVDQTDIMKRQSKVVFKSADLSATFLRPQPLPEVPDLEALAEGKPLSGAFRYLVPVRVRSAGDRGAQQYRLSVWFAKVTLKLLNPLPKDDTFKIAGFESFDGTSMNGYTLLLGPIFAKPDEYDVALNVWTTPGEHEAGWEINCDDGHFPEKKRIEKVLLTFPPFPDVDGALAAFRARIP
jgi:hypothetical protein